MTGQILSLLMPILHGCDIELDISIAHPWAGHTLSQSAIEDGVAAAKREQEKIQKYANELDILGNQARSSAS